MTDNNVCLWNEALELLRDHLNTMHAVVHEKHLSAAVNLAQDDFTDQAFVVFAYSRAYRQALLWRSLHDAHVPCVHQSHVQRTGDGCCSQGEHVNLVAQLLEQLFMHNAKALLFVNDQ